MVNTYVYIIIIDSLQPYVHRYHFFSWSWSKRGLESDSILALHSSTFHVTDPQPIDSAACEVPHLAEEDIKVHST
jgi:hypothetical protein